MTWGRYEGADTKIEGPNHDYGQWFHFANPISKAEVVRAPTGYTETTVHLYTDGSSKGSQKTRDRKCFSGWGCHMLIEDGSGQDRSLDFHGGLYNADPHTAEVSAVYQALTRIKERCKIHIHSDSQYVITALKNLPDFIAKRTKAIEIIPQDQRSALEKMEYTRLDLWKRVQQELEKPLIKGLTIQWIKSHQLDDQGIQLDGMNKEVVRDLKGNDRADKLSNIGAIIGVLTSLEKLAEYHTTDPKAYEWSARILKKNFAASWFCKESAIMYLVEKPTLLTPDIISNILDPHASKRIECAIRDGIVVKPANPALVQTITSAQDIQKSRPTRVINEQSYSRT